MIEYSAQVNAMCPITKGPKHGPAPIPEEGQWVKAYKIEDTKLPCNFKRVSGTAAFYQFLTDP